VDEPVVVTRELLDWDLSTADVLRLVQADAYPAALVGVWAAGSDIVCSEPTAIRCDPEQPWDALDEVWPRAEDGGAAFAGGWIGYLGFGLTSHVLPAPPPPGGARRLPSWWLGYYDHVLRRDRASGRWFFEALRTPARAEALDARLAGLRRRAAAARPQPRPYACGEFRLTPGAAAHQSAVRRTIDYIREGDIFQANICLRLEASFEGDPLDAFCTAVTGLDPPYAAYLRPSAEGAVVSLSPELFLRREGRTVSSRPIKGTGPRPAGEHDACAARVELERSAKNRAENVMIVDLMRNDLSRVCEPGSVTVPRLAAAEPHPGIWHLVSEVRGALCAETGDGQLIRAAFPPGSVTGAPKVRALEVIHELEVTPREVYTGAIGYRSPLAGLELSVAIRTFEFHAGRVWLGAGGGIVAASRPGEEYRECLLKARPLIAAIGGCLAGRPARSPRRAGSDPAMLPRPAAGVFTSLRVREGAVQHLGAHLDRLADSARRLYGKELPESLDTDLDRCLAPRPTGRLRITVRPRGGPLQATVEVVPLDNASEVAGLVPVVIPGGIGEHKWADRRLLGQLAQTAGTSQGVQLLIEDDDGTALETDRANLFAVIESVLRTPPADGRLLPGITRARVLRLAEAAGLAVETAPLNRQDLLSASEVFVTNSVHGVLAVRSVAGVALPAAPGPATERMAAALAAEARGADAPPAEISLPRVHEAGPTAEAEIGLRRQLITRPSPAKAAPLVVVIDNYDSFTYNLVHYLAMAGCAVEVVRNDEVTASQIVTLGPAGVVISPGPCAPHEAGISIDVVRGCASNPVAIPVLGVCLGHQAIAAGFGASIVRTAPVHGQASIINHDGRGVLAGLPRQFAGARYHSLMVADQTVPPCLHITARTRGGIPMGLRHASLPIEGVQFHPESVLTNYGHDIIGNFVSALPTLSRTDAHR
jgi:para-aminobenzoate synthetase/4-amino-4-deoxychorismate lyase